MDFATTHTLPAGDLQVSSSKTDPRGQAGVRFTVPCGAFGLVQVGDAGTIPATLALRGHFGASPTLEPGASPDPGARGRAP